VSSTDHPSPVPPEIPAAERPAEGGSAPSPMVIVVAEDEPAIRLVLTNKLKQAGYVVHAAANGQDGLALVRQVRPQLVITDYEMPRMDGLAMARAMTLDGALRTIPLIVLSARGHRLGGADVHDTNVQQMLMKPFSMREILSIVADYSLALSSGAAKAKQPPELGAAA
jgi:CheY-like chemotaxis protein